jgi:murein DD-endopeptidase MepM/ murein hydrolase activator NlpD
MIERLKQFISEKFKEVKRMKQYIWPMYKGTWITSAYGNRNSVAVPGTIAFHNGIDLWANDRRIRSINDGTVKKVGWSDIYGKYVIVEYEDKRCLVCCHLAEIFVVEFQSIKQGDNIGMMGGTGGKGGNGYPPHLHFEILDYYNDRWGNNDPKVGHHIDPCSILPYYKENEMFLSADYVKEDKEKNTLVNIIK